MSPNGPGDERPSNMPRGAVDCEQCDGTGIVVCECCGGEQQTDGEPCDCAAPEWRPIAGHQYCKMCHGEGWYIPERDRYHEAVDRALEMGQDPHCVLHRGK